MKRLLCIFLTLMILLSALPSAFAVEKDVTGDVMIYTSMYPMVVDIMSKALKKQFPNLNVEFFYGGTGVIQNKLIGEMETGTLGCDMMLMADPSYAIELKEGGWLHAFDFENKENLAFEYDEEGYWYPVRMGAMMLAYNPEKFNKEDLPKSFKEFAERESLKNKISMSNPLTSGSALVTVSALLDKYGTEYLDALGKNNVFIESGATALAKLESGECEIIMMLEESILQKREEDGSKLELIYPEDGNIIVPSPVMIVDESKSPNVNVEACEAICEWLLSEEGQQIFVDGYLHSVLKNFKNIPYDSIPTSQILENSMPVDWERTYKTRETIRNEFQERVNSK